MAHVIRQSISIAAVSLLAVAAPQTVVAADGAAPTFSKDVAPIFYKNCVMCHRPGEAAPMSLISYESTRPWARAIKKKVVAREMPPWFADPQFGHFDNDRSLSQKEIDTIAAWVDAGAPKGRDADLPKVPTLATGWLHPNGTPPDAIIEQPVEVKTDGAGQIPWWTYYTPVPFAEDKFVEATQVKPGNVAFVHHIVVQGFKPQPGTKIDPVTAFLVDAKTGQPLAEQRTRGEGLATPETPVSPRANRRAQDVFDTSSNVWIGQYAPGWTFEKHRPGIGKRIPAGWNMGFNTHYQVTGKPESDRSSIGLWYQKVPLQQEMLTMSFGGETQVVEGRQLLNGERGRPVVPNIPPYAENYSIIGVTPILEPIAIYSFNPHMHLRGHDMKYVAVYPDGREETLINVPKYDFNWQLPYANAEAVRLPAGSKLVVYGHYDNSVKNRFNPAPGKEVYWSEQSWDEMYSPFMEFTKDAKAAKPTDSRQH